MSEPSKKPVPPKSSPVPRIIYNTAISCCQAAIDGWQRAASLLVTDSEVSWSMDYPQVGLFRS